MRVAERVTSMQCFVFHILKRAANDGHEAMMKATRSLLEVITRMFSYRHLYQARRR